MTSLRHPLPRLMLAVIALLVLSGAQADERPLWEFGLGAGVLVFNDYRGSNTVHALPLPIPYFVYHGDLLKADREGVRSQLFHQNRVELTLSVNATTPVRNDSARAGMPDLRSTLEIGPQINVHLWQSREGLVKLDLRVPVRAALTLEARPHFVGTFTPPVLNLDLVQSRGDFGWKLGLLAGPLFAQRRYNDYFYTVAPQFATATRPAYQAPGGYAGAQVLVSLTRRFRSFWIGAYARHDTLSGASFEESPLVRQNSYWSTGVAVAWIVAQSSQMVESED
ncbi:MAG TPA: MipA/OmpV family protein [Steroidobacteraceae bacterium]|nr:MipA/OmpV family protein [Steroidobacteraceae bacterium]